MSSHTDQQPISSLIGSVLTAMNGLVRNEVDLARAEITDSAKTAGVAVGMIAAAMVIAFVALNVLTGALVAAIVDAGLTPGWASLVVGIAYAIIAGVLVMAAIRKLESFSLAPKRTARNLKQDVATLMEAAK